MMSRTGINKISRQKGFTLIEVMVTVAILSLGTLLIHGVLLRSSDILVHYNNQLTAEAWVDEKMWDVREALLFSESGTLPETSGIFVESGKNFNWSVETKIVSGTDKLYWVHLNAAWPEGNRQVHWSKAAYMTANQPTTI